MGTMRSVTLAAMGLLLLGMTVQIASAQQPAPPPAEDAKAEAMEEIRLTRDGIAVVRQTLITEGMDLTPDEMQVFWPLYRDYRSEATKIGDRIVGLITRYAENYDGLTDEAADKLLAEFVSIEQTRARLKARYLPKFKKVLPARKIIRFYQLENKLDIAILAEVAEYIPLAR
jgi:Spy/CpxP family protein refolding chaperone